MENALLYQTLADYDLHFEDWWRGIFSEYREGDGDRLWLAGPSSYVFSLSGVRFAVDLQIRRACDLERVKDTLVEDLSELSFMLITHQHDDHFCIPLMQMAVDKGLAVRPTMHTGICGEHGGDPVSVEFCHKLGLTYVSCSPFRVPIARLAAAQAALK